MTAAKTNLRNLHTIKNIAVTNAVEKRQIKRFVRSTMKKKRDCLARSESVPHGDVKIFSVGITRTQSVLSVWQIGTRAIETAY